MSRTLRTAITRAFLFAGFLAGCRCEKKLSKSECEAADRCRMIFAREAHLDEECLGEKLFLRCERHPNGEPALSAKRLLRDPDGRYWYADPEDMPHTELVEDAGALFWSSCD